MKKWIGCLVFLVLMSSCAEEVAFNSPSVQGLQNNQFWRALQSKATIDDKGTITIQAVTTNETLTLYITPPITGAKKLNQNSDDYATFEKRTLGGSATLFTTKNELSSGKITITDYDINQKTISGTFTFLSSITNSNSNSAEELYFSQGVFYQVPISEKK